MRLPKSWEFDLERESLSLGCIISNLSVPPDNFNEQGNAQEMRSRTAAKLQWGKNQDYRRATVLSLFWVMHA